MTLNQVGVGLGVFASLAAGAALVRWPYNLLSEAILDVAALLAVATVVTWLIGLFYQRIHPLLQRTTLIGAGAVLGIYLAISVAYFFGYIGYNYPGSQQLIYSLTQQIAGLTAALEVTKERLSSTEKQLTDAHAAMSNPNAVSNPTYTLDTSLTLQFNKDGNAEAIQSHNITWDLVTVPQATEVSAAVSPPSQPQQPQRSRAYGILEQPTSSHPIGSIGNTCQECKECLACPPTGPTYETHNAILLVLTFPYPIRASEVKLNSYGVPLADNKVLRLTERDGVIMFQQSIRNSVLNIEIAESSGGNKQ